MKHTGAHTLFLTLLMFPFSHSLKHTYTKVSFCLLQQPVASPSHFSDTQQLPSLSEYWGFNSSLQYWLFPFPVIQHEPVQAVGFAEYSLQCLSLCFLSKLLSLSTPNAFLHDSKGLCFLYARFVIAFYTILYKCSVANHSEHLQMVKILYVFVIHDSSTALGCTRATLLLYNQHGTLTECQHCSCRQLWLASIASQRFASPRRNHAFTAGKSPPRPDTLICVEKMRISLSMGGKEGWREGAFIITRWQTSHGDILGISMHSGYK